SLAINSASQGAMHPVQGAMHPTGLVGA
ncbi:MAG: hypothetical protein RLY14_908, partial [Planctomycetota bacterium]